MDPRDDVEKSLEKHFRELEFLRPFFAIRDAITFELLKYAEKDCKSCGRIFGSPNDLAAHRRGLPTFECCLCNINYQRDFLFALHLERYHKNPNGSMCCVCDDPAAPKSVKSAHLINGNCPKNM